MIYEVRARLFFNKEDEAKDFYHDCEKAYPKAVSVNPDSLNSEVSFADLVENHHDEDPHSPCSVISSLP